MDNSIFTFTKDSKEIQIERFHLCTWEFKNSKAIVEVGCEINWSSVRDHDSYSIEFYIPCLGTNSRAISLYPQLKDSENSKFIFNDSIQKIESLDGGNNRTGVIHHFYGQSPLCILPITLNTYNTHFITASFNLRPLKDFQKSCNLYFRFYIETTVEAISIRKHGLNKSTILYDLKINEKRNLPETVAAQLQTNKLCKINSCFCIHIIPNDYELLFPDSSLKNVRTLEYDSFKKYIGDDKFKDEELIVMFKKKQGADSYSFFSVFSKERIGAGLFAFAAFVNLFCGLLLYLPSIRGFRPANSDNISLMDKLPIEFILASLLLTSYTIFLIIKAWTPVKMNLSRLLNTYLE